MTNPTHTTVRPTLWLLTLLCGVIMVLAPMHAMADEEAGGKMTDEELTKLKGEFDKLTDAFKGEDCAAMTTKLKAYDTAPLKTLMTKAQKAYPDGPPESMKKSFEDLMTGVKGAMGKCATDEAFKAEFDRVGKAMDD